MSLLGGCVGLFVNETRACDLMSMLAWKLSTPLQVVTVQFNGHFQLLDIATMTSANCTSYSAHTHSVSNNLYTAKSLVGNLLPLKCWMFHKYTNEQNKKKRNHRHRSVAIGSRASECNEAFVRFSAFGACVRVWASMCERVSNAHPRQTKRTCATLTSRESLIKPAQTHTHKPCSS